MVKDKFMYYSYFCGFRITDEYGNVIAERKPGKTWINGELLSGLYPGTIPSLSLFVKLSVLSPSYNVNQWLIYFKQRGMVVAGVGKDLVIDPRTH